MNQESLDLLKRILEDAQFRYQSGGKEKVSIQEVYQFRVEIGKEQRRRLELERMRQVAKARINTLMHLDPENPLPNFVAVNRAAYNSGFIGPRYQALNVNNPANGVENLRTAVNQGQFANRLGLLEDLRILYWE